MLIISTGSGNGLAPGRRQAIPEQMVIVFIDAYKRH